MKTVLCDSSSLISLTDTCFIDVFYFLSKKFDVDFVIPPSVRKEIIDRPLSIQMKAYQLSALRMKKALSDGVLIEVNADTELEAKNILSMANTSFFVRGKPIHLIDLGEADMIALAHALNINLLLMDERTTRMLIEAPFRLKEHLEKELHTNIMLNKKSFEAFRDYTRDMQVIRSSELLTVAFEKGFISKEMFEAGLYALKYNGCSISFDEIEEIKRLVI